VEPQEAMRRSVNKADLRAMLERIGQKT